MPHPALIGSRPLRVGCVLGVRPHFIKFSALVQPTASYNIEWVALFTCQHSPDVMVTFSGRLGEVRSDCNPVSVWQRQNRLDQMTDYCRDAARRLGLDALVVIGDTHSTLAGARAAAALGLPLIHIEAGLAVGPCSQPESVVRGEIESMAPFGCTPHLECASVGPHSTFSGDLLLDAFGQGRGRVDKKEPAAMLVTLHRQELLSDRRLLEHVLAQIDATGMPSELVLHPSHRAAFKDLSARHHYRFLRLVDPLPRGKFLETLWRFSLVLTDSGGVLREALFAGKRTIHAGGFTAWERAGGHEAAPCVWDFRKRALVDEVSGARAPNTSYVNHAFGGGNAARRISRAIVEWMS
jgi:UDP-N-acetylglucosamine 2-epimerase